MRPRVLFGALAAGAIVLGTLLALATHADAAQICDANIASRCVKVNADGSITVGAVGTFTPASDGVIGSPAPLSASQIGAPDASGNTQAITPTNPLNVTLAPTTNAAGGVTPVVSASAEASHVIKAGAGLFYDAYVTTGATAGYFLAFNATTDPADGAVTPRACIPAPANQSTYLAVQGSPPVPYTTGVVLVFSTTGCFTKTESATAFFSGRVK